MAGKTMQELLADCELKSSAEQTTKVASEAPTTSQIDRVINEMGISGGAAAVKTAAADNQENTGGSMGLHDIYKSMVGEGAAPAEGSEKVAAAAAGGETTTATDDGTNGLSEAFGERVGHYFNVAVEGYTEKHAADLETEAGKGEQPLAHVQPGGSMQSAIGKPADPALAVNHSASDGEIVHTNGSRVGSYPSLKEVALKKAILRRSQAAPVGNIVD